MKTIRFPETDALYDHVAARFEALAGEAVSERRRFLVALSGGSTPIPLYERLAYSKSIEWEAVHVFWSDERCVPPDDPASNYGTTRRALLEGIPIPSGNVHRIEGERDPVEAADAYEVLIRHELAEDGRLDLVLLGIGADGHTASLFPLHQALTETVRWILPVHVSAEPAWRITMTLPLINAARQVILLAVGRDKAEAVAQMGGSD
ncbi:6-phosphogluconolactonase, partial [Candidatus Bipolaricaulota bacterium]